MERAVSLLLRISPKEESETQRPAAVAKVEEIIILLKPTIIIIPLTIHHLLSSYHQTQRCSPKLGRESPTSLLVLLVEQLLIHQLTTSRRSLSRNRYKRVLRKIKSYYKLHISSKKKRNKT